MQDQLEARIDHYLNKETSELQTEEAYRLIEEAPNLPDKQSEIKGALLEYSMEFPHSREILNNNYSDETDWDEFRKDAEDFTDYFKHLFDEDADGKKRDLKDRYLRTFIRHNI